MTSQQYPSGPNLQYQYDAMGRSGGMTENSIAVASATYGVAGEMLNLSYDAYSETRTYNSLLQLTRMTVAGAMDMEYVYLGGQNNGRITQAKDWISGETVGYTYDALNRLASAAATNGTWGQAFAYDGFGNLTGKTATQGSAPTLSVRSADEPPGGSSV
jgi:YD repeat-containing protein